VTRSLRTRSRRRADGRRFGSLAWLTATEAQIVLRELLASRPELRDDAASAADALLASVSLDDVAERVFHALEALDLDDMKVGPTARGYVEPLRGGVDSH
jgi:hypothetical protein